MDPLLVVMFSLGLTLVVAARSPWASQQRVVSGLSLHAVHEAADFNGSRARPRRSEVFARA